MSTMPVLTDDERPLVLYGESGREALGRSLPPEDDAPRPR